MNLVGKVVEAGQIEWHDGVCFFDKRPVILLPGAETLGMKVSGEHAGTSGVKLNLASGRDAILMVDTVDGFAEDKDCRMYPKFEFLNHYGYEQVRSFAVARGRLYHLIDDARFELRVGDRDRVC